MGRMIYQKIRSDYPNAIIFERVSDRYLSYGPDAMVVSRICNTPLYDGKTPNSKNGVITEVTESNFDNALTTLIGKGCRIVIFNSTNEDINCKTLVRTSLGAE